MDKKFLNDFGRVVRQEREALHLSQEAFADLCGLHRTYIGCVERGERNLTLLNVIKIAHALNLPSSSLLQKMELEPKL